MDVNGLNFDRVLELLAERIAQRLSQNPGRLVPRLMSVDQAASYIARSTEAMQHLVSAGKIPVVRADRRVFIDRNDLDRWIENNKTGLV